MSYDLNAIYYLQSLTLLEDFEDFIRCWGDVVRRRPFLNLVQCGLQWPSTNPVHGAALRKVSHSNRPHPYLLTK